jgi:hypothetical protein
MARDVFAVFSNETDMKQEFSISKRVIIKQRNRLSPDRIRDLMQYKQ